MTKDNDMTPQQRRRYNRHLILDGFGTEGQRRLLDAKVLIVAPVAPHNLNIRPIIVPRECKITLSFLSRDPYVKFSADNNFVNIPSSETVRLSMAPFSLKRVKLEGDSFIKALSDKLFWGEDKRNGR